MSASGRLVGRVRAALTHARPRCRDCGHRGDPRLCACMRALGEALRDGRLEQARRLHRRIVAAARADRRSR